MKLIDILGERISPNNNAKDIISWLHTQASDIIRDASAHLEYVRNVLVEFDKHNAEHSERVLDIIEKLLGERAKDLSSYDLFSLIASSYLHDCGMAVSDFEINAMKLIENKNYDGQKVLTNNEAHKLIEDNKNTIFKSERSANNVKNCMFYPGDEKTLIDYYSDLLRDYQEFRNGKIDLIRNGRDNQALRTDYIRITHADRAETYIKTWGKTRFADFCGNQSMGKRLADNIASICKAHGMDDDYVRKLGKRIMYIGDETSNLQFIAMMLRIGDIVHFSYDRAPTVLCALHNFESDFSYEQWHIKKDSGINYSISDDGEISYSAYCSIPNDYYNLMRYVNTIDNEIGLYNRLHYEEKWEKKYYPALAHNKVNRDNIDHDDSFIPVPNLKFTLEQNRILDLLMGAELYSDEYACLRELYQNSLDACRCQIAIDNSNGKDSTGKIEFGIETDKEGNRYVYCLDNGKGMNKYIIENYLLKIGSSYYRSSDFYQSQAATGNTFTPTSQFGIGILSCFMIGDKIEITTKEEKGDYISCVMENHHDTFYYTKESPTDDQEQIPSSGTLVKIFLNNNYKDKISNEQFDNIGFLIWHKGHRWVAKNSYYDLSNHLYYVIDEFVNVVPKHIELSVKMENNTIVKVYNKPHPLGKGIFSVPKDFDRNISFIIENSTIFDIDVKYDGIQCTKCVVLPTLPSELRYYSAIVVNHTSLNIDGIEVDFNDYESPLKETSSLCCLNFIGSERPQLSISREKIVNYNHDKFNDKIEKALSLFVKQALDKIANHISSHNIEQSPELYDDIWESFAEQFDNISPVIFAQCLKEESIKDYIMPFTDCFTTSRITFGDLMEDIVTFENYHFFLNREINGCPSLLLAVFIHRISHAEQITIDGNKITIQGYQPDNNRDWYFTEEGLFKDYDIVPHLSPFISKRLNIEEFNNSIFYIGNSAFIWLLGQRFSSRWLTTKQFMMDEIHKISLSSSNLKKNIYTCISETMNTNRPLLRLESIEPTIRYMDSGDEKAIISFVTITKEMLNDVPDSTIKDFVSKSLDEKRDIEGISFIQFGYEDFYTIPGRHTRNELLDLIPPDVLNNLHMEYHFTDGTPVNSKKQKRKTTK